MYSSLEVSIEQIFVSFLKRTQNDVSTQNSRKKIFGSTDTSNHRLSKLDEKTKIKIVFLFLFAKTLRY